MDEYEINEDNLIEIELSDFELEIEDSVQIEFTRLSGDLIPIVALVNQSNNNRIVYRYRDLDQDGQLDDDTYILNDEAGAGRYKLQIAADPELNEESSGDYILVYTIRRGSRILNEVQQIVYDGYEAPIIMISAPEGDETITFFGEINDESYRVDYLLSLDADQPLQFTITAESGDLEPLIGFTPANEEEFIIETAVDGIVSKIYPEPDDASFVSGFYIIAVTRDEVDRGTTSGRYKLEISLIQPG